MGCFLVPLANRDCFSILQKELQDFEKKVEGWCIDETLKSDDLKESRKSLQDEQPMVEAKLKTLTAAATKNLDASKVNKLDNATKSQKVEAPSPSKMMETNNAKKAAKPESKKVEVSVPPAETAAIDSLTDGSGSPEAKRKRVSWRDESGGKLPLEEVNDLTQASATPDLALPEAVPGERPFKKRALVYETAFDSDSSDDLFSVLTPSKVKTYQRKPTTSTAKAMKFFRSRGAR